MVFIKPKNHHMTICDYMTTGLLYDHDRMNRMGTYGAYKWWMGIQRNAQDLTWRCPKSWGLHHQVLEPWLSIERTMVTTGDPPILGTPPYISQNDWLVLKIRNFSTSIMEEESNISESSMKTKIKKIDSGLLNRRMVYPVTFSFLEVFEYVPPFRVSPLP